MKKAACACWAMLFFSVLSSFSGSGQAVNGATDRPSEKQFGLGEKILGFDVAPSIMDDAEKEFSSLAVQYPTNSSLGYKGVVMANVNSGNVWNDEVVVDFGSIGVWVRDMGTWHQITAVNPDWIISGALGGTPDEEIIADFGSLGLWIWDYAGYPGTWKQITGENPLWAMVAEDDYDDSEEIQANFGASFGLWRYDDDGGGTWEQMSTFSPVCAMRGGNRFGGWESGIQMFPSYGVYELSHYSILLGSVPIVVQLTGTVTLEDDHTRTTYGWMFDFGGLGIWRGYYKYMGAMGNQWTWEQISGGSPNRLGGVNGENCSMVIDFNSNIGLYVWVYTGVAPGDITMIHPLNPDLGFCETFDPDGNTETPAREEIAADFGSEGLWIFDPTTGVWSKLHDWDPVFMVRGDHWNDGYDTTLIVDFGANGLWSFDGRYKMWARISTYSPDGEY